MGCGLRVNPLAPRATERSRMGTGMMCMQL